MTERVAADSPAATRNGRRSRSAQLGAFGALSLPVLVAGLCLSGLSGWQGDRCWVALGAGLPAIPSTSQGLSHRVKGQFSSGRGLCAGCPLRGGLCLLACDPDLRSLTGREHSRYGRLATRTLRRPVPPGCTGHLIRGGEMTNSYLPYAEAGHAVRQPTGQVPRQRTVWMGSAGCPQATFFPCTRLPATQPSHA